MAKKIKFDSTLTGDIDDLDVIIQGALVPSPGLTVKFSKTLEDDILKVKYQISGDNGTGYSIAYTCSSDGTAKSDSTKPTPLTGTIAAGGYVEEILNIPI